MGEFPARITAPDFVTPPEFADWQLAANGAGRIGGARFALSLRDQATQVVELYEQIPIRILPLHLGPGEPTLVYLLNPANGLMDGDAHRLEIHAGAGTRSVITGQSATRVHPCLRGFCTQQWKVTVADDAILVVLPGPTIPFAGCRYFQRVEVDLGKNARLIWGDLCFAGRYARAEASERFRFEGMVQEMSIHREGKLIFRDRFAWQGPWDDEAARWHFGGGLASGTLFATGTHVLEAAPASETTRRALFTTAAGDTYCRWTGSSAAAIHAVAETSLRWASEFAKSTATGPWLLHGHQLARTHWFDVIGGR